MRETHPHLRERMHIDNIERHIGQWLHDPRFWAAAALIVVFGLLIITLMFSETGLNTKGTMPMHPYVP